MSESINCVIMPVTGARILMPNATVAAMVSFTEVLPADGYPDHIIGLTTWQGWNMPLLSLSQLLGLCEEESLSQARVAIIKTIGGQKHPYFGLLLQGFPRLTEVNEEDILLADEDDEQLAAVKSNHDALLAHIEQLGGPVWVTNLDRLSHYIQPLSD